MPGTTYSFDVFATHATDGSGTSTYLDLFNAGSTAYAGGLAYNSYSARETFNDDYVASEQGGSLEFVVGLTPAPLPEPASMLGIATVGSLALIRRRRA